MCSPLEQVTTPRAHLVLSVFVELQGHLPKHGLPIRGATLHKTDLPSPSGYQLSLAPQLGWEFLATSLVHDGALVFSCAGFVLAVRANVSLYVEQHCM